MTAALNERHRLAFLGWLATVAGSLSFFPALANKDFLLFGAMLSALAVAIGVGLRQLRAPSLVAALVQLVVVVEILGLSYGGHAKFWVIPTAGSFDEISAKIRHGIDIANRFAAPTPETAGLTLLVVFLIAVVAVLVDYLVAGIGRVPLAGLPLLALYTVPAAALPHGIPALAFLPGAIAYIVLLMTAERDRLAHWGRFVARGTTALASDSLDASALSASGRRIGLAALVLAVGVPVLLPGFTSGIFHGGNGIGPGSKVLSFGDPMVSLAHSLQQPRAENLLAVSSRVEPEYLRMVVLDKPGPDAWTVNGVNLGDTISTASQLPAPIGQNVDVPASLHQMSITPLASFPKDSAWLPVPYDMSSTDVDSASWGFVPSDSTVVATRVGAASVLPPYDAHYGLVDPSEAQLENASPPPLDIVRKFGTVPSSVPYVITQTAAQVTTYASNDYQRALLLQNFFRKPSQFTYDVHAAYGNGYNGMAEFLQKRRGYCQQFAATMAMMARTLGIPSRVVVGFLAPERVSQNTYVFTSHDLHAWPELYFSGVGWVRFEPTPGNGAVPPQWAPSTAAPTSIPTASEGPSRPNHVPSLNQTQHSTASLGSGSNGSSGGGAPPSRLWLLVPLVIALLLAPGAARLAVRRNRMTRPIDAPDAAESAWRELRDHMRDLRVPWRGSMTPRARSRAVQPLLAGSPAGLAALSRLTVTVERARYAATPSTGSNPASDAREVMAAISRTAEWPTRILAMFWPSSLMPDLKLGWRRLSSALRRT
ncbi:MAG: transglutaminase TgpA family protein [Nocardioidaceae bacterium]